MILDLGWALVAALILGIVSFAFARPRAFVKARTRLLIRRAQTSRPGSAEPLPGLR
jgi:hypothetical protein